MTQTKATCSRSVHENSPVAASQLVCVDTQRKMIDLIQAGTRNGREREGGWGGGGQRERDRQTDRQTGRGRRDTERQTDRLKQIDTETDRQPGRG